MNADKENIEGKHVSDSRGRRRDEGVPRGPGAALLTMACWSCEKCVVFGSDPPPRKKSREDSRLSSLDRPRHEFRQEGE